MSTTTTINFDTTTDAAAHVPPNGLFHKSIDARMRKGADYVSRYLNRQSDESLAGLGFKPDEIAHIRQTGKIPGSFWR